MFIFGVSIGWVIRYPCTQNPYKKKTEIHIVKIIILCVSAQKKAYSIYECEYEYVYSVNKNTLRKE
jgi:hypothetical protein